MLDGMYEWMKNLAFYLVIVTAVLEVLPGESYRKYIRFFAGTVLILLILTPLLQLTGSLERFQQKYQNHESELIRQEILESREYFEDADIFAFLQDGTDGKFDLETKPEAKSEFNSEAESEMRVEEIEIGKNQRVDFDMDAHRRETTGETAAFGDSADRTVIAGDCDSGTGEE